MPSPYRAHAILLDVSGPGQLGQRDCLEIELDIASAQALAVRLGHVVAKEVAHPTSGPRARERAAAAPATDPVGEGERVPG